MKTGIRIILAVGLVTIGILGTIGSGVIAASPEAEKSIVESPTKIEYKTTITEEQSRGWKAVTITLTCYEDEQECWDFNQRIEWSYDGEEITSTDLDVWGNGRYYYPWVFYMYVSADTTSSEYGGSGYSYYLVGSSGHFIKQTWLWPIDPWTHYYPSIYMVVYADGTWNNW